MFRRGQIVVCLDPHIRGPMNEITPKMGHLYTVRYVKHYPTGTGLRFYEIRNPSRRYKYHRGEATFDADLFIAIANPDMLINPHKRVEVEA